MKFFVKLVALIFFISLNLLGILIGLFALQFATLSSNNINIWFGLAYSFIAFYCLIFVVYKGVEGHKFLARFGIGLTILFFSFLYLGIEKSLEFIDHKYVKIGEYYPFKVEENFGEYYTDIGEYIYTMHSSKHNVNFKYEEISNIDSIYLRIDTGYFGNLIISEKYYEIRESQNCNPHDVDSLNLVRSNIEIANELKHKRCFSGAIDHYSRALDIKGEGDESVLFNRALLCLFYKDYNNALIDLSKSFLLYIERVDPEDLDKIISLTEDDMEILGRKIAEEFKNEKFDDFIMTYAHVASTKQIYEEYEYLINLCIERTKKEKAKQNFQFLH
jgi:tetratricopeptide (TPR) repeat protein